MSGNYSLLVAVAPIVVGLLGLIGTRWVAGIQNKAKANEENLRRYEGYDHTYNNLRADYDRVVAENRELRAENQRLKET